MTKETFMKFASDKNRCISNGCYRNLNKSEYKNYLKFLLENTKDFNVSLKYKLYLYFYDYKSIPKCENCGKMLSYIQCKTHKKYCSNKCQLESFKEYLI